MIRPATSADAAAIAQIHVTAWRQSYGGLLPDAMIAAHTIASRTALWQQILAAPATAGGAVFVAEEDRGIVGFGACGPQRTPELQWSGYGAEIGALYVLADAHGRGLGTALLAALAQALRHQGHDAVSLWVLRTNTLARRFTRGAAARSSLRPTTDRPAPKSPMAGATSTSSPVAAPRPRPVRPAPDRPRLCGRARVRRTA
ncbi:MAG: GNAT family N-acetyltransferase [Pseudomonadota bacterium]|jgi:GNAT superfamily N-acetyltransferase